MKRFYGLTAMISLCLSVCASGLKAQSCGGNGDIGGSYAFVGSRAIFPGVPFGPPGTSGSASSGTSGNSPGSSSAAAGSTPSATVSNTPIGQLIGGMSGSTPFAVVGRVVTDGAGNLLGSQTPTGALVPVGSYTVNQDCTIAVTLNDVFVGVPVTPPGTAGNGGTSSTGGGGNSGNSSGTGGSSGNAAAGATPASIKVVGVVLDRGAEIDLTQAGASNTGAVITLRRAVQFAGCTDANVTGTFGLIAEASVTSGQPSSSGVTAGSGGSSSSLGAASVIGRLAANGAGMFLPDAQATQSPLQALQLTGTYVVADDCSGSAQFADTSGTMHNIDFVIVQAESNASTPNTLQVTLPELLFSFTDQGVTGTGFAKHE